MSSRSSARGKAELGMSALTKFTSPTGHDLTTLHYKGQPCWIAQEIGQVLEYSSNGSKLTNKITQDWASEMIEGEDYHKLEGEELAEIKAALDQLPPESGGSSPVHPYARNLLLLTEQGVYLACIKTNKPAGITLRRWLASEVLPALRATGTYTAPSADATLALQRERRLSRELELEERKWQASALSSLLDTLEGGDIDPLVLDAYRVVAVEIATGRQLGALKPAAPEGVWMSPTEIAGDLGSTAAMVGIVVSALGLRDGNHSRKVLGKAKGHDRTITTYIYDAEAVALIREELIRRGKIAA